jgi:hypothetical protein
MTPETEKAPAAFADLAAQWREAGILPASAESGDATAQRAPAKPFDVAAALRAQRLERFREQCPAEFRKPINAALLPNIRAWEKADAWAGGYPGIWLWSHATGRGKTRMAWRQFGRLHVEHGKQIIKATGQALAEEYFAAHMDGQPRSFYRWLMRADLIVIDDADKIDLSDRRYVRMVRELFDELYAHRKPAIVTANEPIAWFAKNCGESCARRMREVCAEVEF